MRAVSKCLFTVVLFLPVAALALDVGSDGSDGALNITSNTVIDLGEATTGFWDSPGNGLGIYDAAKWAVVFKYSSVNIAAGSTVSFTNHPSGAPVVWLVQGDASIAGGVNLNGSGHCTDGSFAPGGPGGFRGSPVRSSGSTSGLGPGGGRYGGYGFDLIGGGSYGSTGDGGVWAGPVYGNARVLPLIGGSGGAGSSYETETGGGGGGGGAILIACGGTLTLSGSVNADGGLTEVAGGGSGGGIRLITDSMNGSLNGLVARGGAYSSGWRGKRGGAGRIRIEANTVSITGGSNPQHTLLTPLEDGGATAVIWPPAGSPTLRVLTVGGRAVPDDPRANFMSPGDIAIGSSGEIEAIVEATNVPITWTVVLRVTPRFGVGTSVTATRVDGDDVSSTWRATLPSLLNNDFTAIQARASQ